MADTQVQQSNGGHGGLYALLVVIVILIVGAILYFSGIVGGRNGEADLEADINIELPEGAPTTND